MAAAHVSSADFDKEVIKSDVPVLVDFYADWCGPCKMLGPIVEEAAKTYEGKIKVCKINVDDAQDVAAKFGIMSIPTLIFFKGGKAVDQKVGSLNKQQLDSFIAKNL